METAIAQAGQRVEHPILFSGPMVRAILEGRKTMTRRVVKPQPQRSMIPAKEHPGVAFELYPAWIADDALAIKCPYGQPGDRLWVRETWRYSDWTEDGYPFVEYAATPGKMVLRDNIPGEWDDALSGIWATLSDPKNYDIDGRAADRRWRPSIHIPRWACRLVLEVVSVRVGRLQDISEEDAMAEGVSDEYIRDVFPHSECFRKPTAREAFRILWDSTNSARGFAWDSNPWVWAIEFKPAKEAI